MAQMTKDVICAIIFRALKNRKSMSKNGRDRLAEALETLKTLQDAGPCYAIKGMKKLGEAHSRISSSSTYIRMQMAMAALPALS